MDYAGVQASARARTPAQSSSATLSAHAAQHPWETRVAVHGLLTCALTELYPDEQMRMCDKLAWCVIRSVRGHVGAAALLQDLEWLATIAETERRAAEDRGELAGPQGGSDRNDFNCGFDDDAMPLAAAPEQDEADDGAGVVLCPVPEVGWPSPAAIAMSAFRDSAMDMCP
eukprot:m51a1_g4133 hypothetical protein (171) ;mRNA; r:197602-198114